ncbi:uncharacterized protein LOC132706211 [Cylas formicarius]|uniref:uncharacterized protein LOC132706211 n=1 Tax=Cylas formicarius TaxID=197179 RepID=UPI002958BB88|nr:uncharacterized protein LOC132706211 [Cylas formicarius]
MQALRYTRDTGKLELCRVSIPEVTERDQVLIKIAYCGICGSDVHIIEGEMPCSQDTKTLGHEFSGTVVKVGPGVTNVTVGDNVTVNPNEGCNNCKHCHAGNPHYCRPCPGELKNTIGIQRNGGMAHYALVPNNSVFVLPKGVSLEQGVLAEPLSCISHGWDLLLPVPIGSKILIIGAGIIGNLCVALLHRQGYKNVTVSEPWQSRLDLLSKLNTGYTLLTPNELTKRSQENPAYLFDVIIDCSGNCKAIEQAFNLLDLGGKLSCFGVAPRDGRISISPFELYRKEAKLVGVNVNPFSFLKAFDYLESLGSRYLDYERLGIEVFSLDDYQAALDKLKSGKIAKAVFKM